MLLSNGIDLECLEYEAAKSKILCLKVLPPWTTYEQWLTKPPALSNSFFEAQPLAKGVVTNYGRGGLQNGRGGHVKFYPYEKGGRKKF